MPFPTVDGKTLFELAKEIFEQIEAVSTQLYEDVQKLKALAAQHGWDIETDDPSQTPISS